MTTRLSARRNAADNRHPIHLAAHRLAEIRARSLQVLLMVAAAPFAATLVCIAVLAARRMNWTFRLLSIFGVNA